IPQRINEDYHSIKDDIPLVSVYTTRNVLVQGMMIPDEFLTEEIRATDDFKELEPESHKENPEYIDDDDNKEKEKNYPLDGHYVFTHKKVDRVLHEIVPQLTERAIDDLIENNLKPSITATIIKDRDAFRLEVPDFSRI
nr:hypothetical protein [Tanacetum cinerariifolium]